MDINELHFNKLEVAMGLNVSKETVSDYLNSGALKGYALGDRIVILLRDLLKFLENNTESYEDLINHIATTFPTEGNESMGYCPDTGKPLTERDLISYSQQEHQEGKSMACLQVKSSET